MSPKDIAVLDPQRVWRVLLEACETGRTNLVTELLQQPSLLQDYLNCPYKHVKGSSIPILRPGLRLTHSTHMIGCTALQVAADAGQQQIVKLLLQAGCQVQQRTRCGRYTALHFAVARGHLWVTRILLNAGASPEEPSGIHVVGEEHIAMNITPLHIAAEAGHEYILREILPKTAPNVADYKLRTALHYASEGGHARIVASLLQAGADPVLSDIEGNTPLLYAVQRGHFYMIQSSLLSTPGARSAVGKANKYGDTPLSLAVKMQQWNLVQLLTSVGLGKTDVSITDLDTFNKHLPMLQPWLGLIPTVQHKDSQLSPNPSLKRALEPAASVDPAGRKRRRPASIQEVVEPAPKVGAAQVTAGPVRVSAAEDLVSYRGSPTLTKLSVEAKEVSMSDLSIPFAQPCFLKGGVQSKAPLPSHLQAPPSAVAVDVARTLQLYTLLQQQQHNPSALNSDVLSLLLSLQLAQAPSSQLSYDCIQQMLLHQQQQQVSLPMAYALQLNSLLHQLPNAAPVYPPVSLPLHTYDPHAYLPLSALAPEPGTPRLLHPQVQVFPLKRQAVDMQEFMQATASKLSQSQCSDEHSASTDESLHLAPTSQRAASPTEQPTHSQSQAPRCYRPVPTRPVLSKRELLRPAELSLDLIKPQICHPQRKLPDHDNLHSPMSETSNFNLSPLYTPGSHSDLVSAFTPNSAPTPRTSFGNPTPIDQDRHLSTPLHPHPQPDLLHPHRTAFHPLDSTTTTQNSNRSWHNFLRTSSGTHSPHSPSPNPPHLVLDLNTAPTHGYISAAFAAVADAATTTARCADSSTLSGPPTHSTLRKSGSGSGEGSTSSPARPPPPPRLFEYPSFALLDGEATVCCHITRAPSLTTVPSLTPHPDKLSNLCDTAAATSAAALHPTHPDHLLASSKLSESPSVVDLSPTKTLTLSTKESDADDKITKLMEAAILLAGLKQARSPSPSTQNTATGVDNSLRKSVGDRLPGGPSPAAAVHPQLEAKAAVGEGGSARRLSTGALPSFVAKKKNAAQTWSAAASVGRVSSV